MATARPIRRWPPPAPAPRTSPRAQRYTDAPASTGSRTGARDSSTSRTTAIWWSGPRGASRGVSLKQIVDEMARGASDADGDALPADPLGRGREPDDAFDKAIDEYGYGNASAACSRSR